MLSIFLPMHNVFVLSVHKGAMQGRTTFPALRQTILKSFQVQVLTYLRLCADRCALY
jgi:hypothetical protein